MAHAPFATVTDHNTLKIATPALASQQTEKLRLGNGMAVYLVADPDIEASAAEMTVAAGSWQDPDAFLGTAHFLEHMLFMGTERFPDENAFDAHLNRHGGRSNAYTASNRTAYTFECKNAGFAAALGRFAAFFEAPLLKADCMQREVQAVHQEFMGNIDNEAWRAHLVGSQLAHPEHPGSRFTIGNLSTLATLDRDTLSAWYQNHYSADRMHLVVYAALPLPALRDLVLETFSGVPQRDLAPLQPAQVPQLDPKRAGQRVDVASRKKDQSNLSLAWDVSAALADDPHAWRGEAVAYVLRHAGAGSLVAELKRRGWVESLQARASRETSGEAVFYYDIDLTDAGVAQRDEVVSLCFAAIAQLRRGGVPRHLFDEMCAQRRLNYTYQSRSDAFGTVGVHGRGLVSESLATYPERRVLPEGFDAAGMAAVLAALRPEHCHLLLSAHPELTGLATDQVEPWMQVAYAVTPVPQATLERWQAAAAPTPEFALPGPNPYVARALALQPLEPGAPTSVAPSCLQDDDGLSLRFARDHLERLPEVYWGIQLRAPQLQDPSPLDRVLASLYVRAVQDALAEIQAAASLAGLYLSVDLGRQSVDVRVEGFSDRAPALLQAILAALRQLAPSPDKFDEFVSSLTNAYVDFDQGSPWRVAMDALEERRRCHWPTHAARRAALTAVRRADFDHFAQGLWQSRHIHATLFGNLSAAQAEAVQAQLQAELPGKPFAPARARPRTVVDLPGGDGASLMQRPVPGADTGVMLCLQLGRDAPELRAMQQVLAQAMGQPFFDALRTQQQTGYKVWSLPNLASDTLYLIYYIEPHQHAPQDVLRRIEDFVLDWCARLDDGRFTEASFAEHRAALLADWQAPPKNLGEEGGRMHRMALRDGNLRRHEQNVAALEALTCARWKPWVQACLRATEQRLAILVLGQRAPVPAA